MLLNVFIMCMFLLPGTNCHIWYYTTLGSVTSDGNGNLSGTRSLVYIDVIVMWPSDTSLALLRKDNTLSSTDYAYLYYRYQV